jgi:lipopolysaccharide transport system ATP-binding protein
MSEIKIVVDNVGKSYRVYKHEFHRFLSWFGLQTTLVEQTDVLSNICFTVSKGEAVALVGENGAGKSTLLKLITGTVQPSYGKISMHGPVAAILELGLGFNPEMTGRKNVYLSAEIMGFRDKEIDSLIDNILAFSELEGYFDKPIRTYSTGMLMRLAFSVATAKRPEVLIIDEALSVGDSYFQHKSFNRIKAFKAQGTTLLFVSHDRAAVQLLCDRAILLEKGNMVKDGKPEQVMDYYNALVAQKKNTPEVTTNQLPDGRVKTVSGTGEAVVQNVVFLDNNGSEIENINVGQAVQLSVTVDVLVDIERLVFGYGLKDRLGQVMYGTNTLLKQHCLEDVKAGSRWVFNFAFTMNLGFGSYSVQTALCASDSHIENNYQWQDLAHIFHVVNIDKAHFAGSSWLDPTLTIEQV